MCEICMCYIEISELSISCSNGHRIHFDDCFKQHLETNSSNPNVVKHWKEHQQLLCPHFASGCTGHICEDDILLLNSPVRKLFFVTIRCIAESVICSETKKHIEREALKNSEELKMNLVDRIVKDIIELVTTVIACPYCKTPFYDFEGCLALTCETCKKNFCGVCLEKHDPEDDDHHLQVISCIQKMPKVDIEFYGFHSNYFIQKDKWGLLCMYFQTNAIIKYLQQLKKEIMWTALNRVTDELKKNNILNNLFIARINNTLYAHEHYNVHLIRIPVAYWMVHSSIFNISLEETMRTVILDKDVRIVMGKCVLDRIRREHPMWNPIKTKVPGETFEAINYPPEFLPLVYEAIIEWGKKNSRW
jgi:hypothetical protein